MNGGVATHPYLQAAAKKKQPAAAKPQAAAKPKPQTVAAPAQPSEATIR